MAEIRRYLDNEFARRRDRALKDAEDRKAQVFSKIPELARIETEINLSGIRFARSLISDRASYNAQELSERINDLLKRKEALLIEHNLPKDYLEPRFSCPACSDKGYITDTSGALVPCSCYQKLYMEHLYQVSNLLDDGTVGFDNFDATLYPDFSDKKVYHMEISPREQIEHIRKQCMDFIDGINESTTMNLYFYGPTGTGKTFMAKSIGLELLKKGYTVLYLSSTSLFSIIRQYRLTSEQVGSQSEQAYRSLYTANLLILDDLGTEPGSDARYAELLTLLEMRKAQDKVSPAKTIISSNLNLKRLFQEYNERIASRIVGEFNTLQFIGDDIRIIKKIGDRL